jgi:nucleotide-binding universal stress UspA family protein
VQTRVLPPETVVVGVDTSASARDAAEWAADVAAAGNGPLHLVHAVPGWPDDAPLPHDAAWLRELADAAERTGVRTVDTEVVPGGIVATLLNRATGARLLVVGSYGEAAWTGMLAGSLAVALIDRARCPVAVVRGSAPQVPPPRRGPFVVGVDGSEASLAALDLAAELATSLGGRLVAVHATDEPTAGPVEVQLAGLRLRHPALSIELRSVEGTALSALGEQAHHARLLVVGRHRAQASGDVVLGATGRGLIESAPCPVVVAAHPHRGLRDPGAGSGQPSADGHAPR